jgi:outer membrane protein assembly factor BamB
VTIPAPEVKDESAAKDAADKPADTSDKASDNSDKASDAKPTEEKSADDKAAPEKPADKPADTKPDAAKSDEKAADAPPPADKPAEKADKKADGAAAPSPAAANPAAQASNPTIQPGDWPQWGGTALRNNTPVAEGILTEWAPGDFDRKTGAWDKSSAKNIKWVSTLGSQTYGNTVVASSKVFLGTNNSNGYLKRYPADIDLGVLVCFNEADGKFLWQHSSEKLPTGRVHDWPLQGICCSPLVEGNRLWFVTSRGEVRCLDVEGFHDGEDDGRPESQEPARLFDVARADDAAQDKVGGYLAELDQGKLPAELRARFEAAGMPLAEGEIAVKADEKAKAPSKRYTFQAEVNGKKRDFVALLAGPRLSFFKIVTPDDKDEADVIWAFDMMKELGTRQHNMCSCSVTALGDILFVNSSNGVDESHLVIQAPDAPSFIAMDKNTGKVYWTDNSPGRNILHGQWSSPTVAVIGGVPQVLFGGGDGWLYSFKADKGQDGKPELLWKFDINPKDSILELGGRGTRNDIISTPVVYEDKVYFATGQDPEHGEGVGILWCIDPTKRGDISEKLAVNRKDPSKPIPVKRIQAVVEADGDMAIDNPNSGVIWKYSVNDANGDGKIEFEEQFHRSISTVAIKNGLLFVPDFSGLFHCVDAATGMVYWTYDMLAAAWGSPLIVGEKVYVGDEDGDIVVFNLSKEKHDPVAEINMGNSVYSTPIVANGVLYIANKDHVFAIAPASGDGTKAGGQ